MTAPLRTVCSIEQNTGPAIDTLIAMAAMVTGEVGMLGPLYFLAHSTIEQKGGGV